MVGFACILASTIKLYPDFFGTPFTFNEKNIKKNSLNQEVGHKKGTL